MDGSLDVEVTRRTADSTLAALVRLVEAAQQQKGTTQRLADRIAAPLVPGVLVLASSIAVIGSVLGDPSVWIERALVVLVAASPCALAIAVPVTVIAAVGSATRHGTLIKGGAALEQLGRIRTIAIDKTGTLTANRPVVTDVQVVADLDAALALNWAAALEARADHPLGDAIVAAATNIPVATEVTNEAGSGVAGLVGGHRIRVGRPGFIPSGPLDTAVRLVQDSGATAVLVERDSRTVAVIAVRDEVRAEAAAVVRELQNEPGSQRREHHRWRPATGTGSKQDGRQQGRESRGRDPTDSRIAVGSRWSSGPDANSATSPADKVLATILPHRRCAFREVS